MKCSENSKIIPITKGECHCCFTEDIEIIECSSNNKCEYSMCKKCIKNLEKKANTDKCPACREQIIIIKDNNLQEPIQEEIDVPNDDRINVILGPRIRVDCCLCMCSHETIRENPNWLCYGIRTLLCLKDSCCCIWNYVYKIMDLAIDNRLLTKCLAVFYTLCIHIVLILLGRIFWGIFFNESSGEYWCVWWLFLEKAVVGLLFFVGFGITALLILSLCCCYRKNENDN